MVMSVTRGEILDEDTMRIGTGVFGVNQLSKHLRTTLVHYGGAVLYL